MNSYWCFLKWICFNYFNSAGFDYSAVVRSHSSTVATVEIKITIKSNHSSHLSFEGLVSSNHLWPFASSPASMNHSFMRHPH